MDSLLLSDMNMVKLFRNSRVFRLPQPIQQFYNKDPTYCIKRIDELLH